MQPTPEQLRAISTHDRHMIVVASAGTGKTRVLVERFLALLETHPDWPLSALVAITFTRKAAGEMRDRVRRGLEGRLRDAATHATPEAASRWSTHLAAMDSARIDTIHGLCGDLLRANAAEIGLDPGFSVLDEGDSALMRAIALDDALASLAPKKRDIEPQDEAAKLWKQNTELILTLFDFYDEYRVREVLSDAALFSVEIPALPDDLMARWEDTWRDNAETLLASIAENPVFQAVVGASRDSIPNPEDDKLAAIWLDAQLEGQVFLNPESPDLEAQFAALGRFADRIKLNVGSAKAWGNKDAVAEAKDALRALRELAQAILTRIGEPPNELDALAARLLPAWSALIARVQYTYRTAKRALPALDFDDLERMTMRLLTDHPHSAERYRGTEFKQLLVDEFQDTNDAQWQIVHALTGPHDHQGLADGRLFVVGDPKQSIYAFRGADVRVFERVREQIVLSSGDSSLIPLAMSFRTHAPLVGRFNTLFEHVLTIEANSPAHEYQIALGTPMAAFRENPPNDSAPLEVVLIRSERGDEMGSEGRRRWEAHVLATRLSEMVASGHVIYDREADMTRPMHYGDVAVLFQSLTKVNIYEEVFRERRIPFLTLAGRGYYGRQEVHDLLNMLTALHNPQNNLALASALRSPLFNFSDDALYALRLTRLSLWAALDSPGEWLPADETELVAFARDTLYRLHQIAGRVTISELLRDALNATGYLATLTGLPDGIQRRGNVEKLLQKAQTSGKVRLGAFQYYLRDLSEREMREGDAALEVEGVARIMTVHASKGLEFPVVVLADASWDWASGWRSSKLLNFSDGEAACRVPWFDAGKMEMADTFASRRAAALYKLREDAERRRLFYVAATRAQDTLIVSGQATPDENAACGWKTSGWLGWLLDALPPSLEDAGLRLHIPDAPPDDSPILHGGASGVSVWERAEIHDGQPLAGYPAAMPPLMGVVEYRPRAQARHLAATSIADLGSAQDADTPDERRLSRDRFRRTVLYAAPDYIRPALPRSTRVKARHVGDIVHEALRYWRLPSGDDNARSRAENALLREQLLSSAWELGITEQAQAEIAVWQAMTLLYNFKRSPLCKELQESPEVYRELPFIYEREQHIVHGVIDVLFRRKDGSWALVDYKTSIVGRPSETRVVSVTALQQHARRYHLQVGVYAEAARAHLNGTAPDAKIHYIRYRTVDIPAAEWGAALARGLGETVATVVEPGRG